MYQVTLLCPGENCPFCAGLACDSCRAAGRPRPLACDHDSHLRHRAIPATEYEPAQNRVSTKDLPPLLASGCVFSLDDGAEIGDFLDHVAKCVRSGRRVRIFVECVDDD